MKMINVKKSILVAVTMLLCACSDIPPEITEVMASLNLTEAQSSKELVLAVPVPMLYAKENTTFLDGVQLASEDIVGMELEIPLRVQVDDDGGEFSSAIVLAQGYIEDPSVVAVVGHWYSDICKPISDVYINGKKVLVVPTVSIPSLTSSFSDYLFRNIPDDDQVGHRMCDYARRRNAKKAVIYYEDSAYGFEMSAGIELYATSIGMSIVDRIREPTLDRDLPALHRKWSAMDYDTVFVVSNVEAGSAFINALSGLGFEGQFVCSDGMDSNSVLSLLNKNSAKVVICSIFNSEAPPAGIQEFQQRFRDRFGKEPDVWAVQGYDCVMIVAQAVAQNNIATSEELSRYFLDCQNLNSIYGTTRFDDRNEIVGKPIFMKAIENGTLQYTY